MKSTHEDSSVEIGNGFYLTKRRCLSACFLSLLLFDCSRTAPGDRAPPAAHDNSEVARALNRRCYPHTGNGGHSWCLSSSLSLLVGFSTLDEAMDAARYVLDPSTMNEREAMS